MKDKAEALGIKVDGRWSDERIQEEIDKVKGVHPPIKESENIFHTVEWANERAAKIWEGQSESLSIIERVGRIRMALKDKGFSRWDELVIPTDGDYKKYL